MNYNQCSAKGGRWDGKKCHSVKKKPNGTVVKIDPKKLIIPTVCAFVVFFSLLMIECDHTFGDDNIPTGTTCKFNPIISSEHLDLLFLHPSGPMHILYAIGFFGLVGGFGLGIGVQYLINKVRHK